MKRLNKISLKTTPVVIEEGLSVMQLSGFELGRLMGGDYAGCYADTCFDDFCSCAVVCCAIDDSGDASCPLDVCPIDVCSPDFI